MLHTLSLLHTYIIDAKRQTIQNLNDLQWFSSIFIYFTYNNQYIWSNLI